jgi:hypothetical protein
MFSMIGSWKIMAVVVALGLFGCKKDAPAPSPSVDPKLGAIATRKMPEPLYEAELEGLLREDLNAPQYVIVFAKEPCTLETLGTVETIVVGRPDLHARPRKFFVEPHVPNRSQAHLCAAALDESGTKVVGFGAHDKNPLTFVQPATGEIVMTGLDVTIQAVKPPVELPAGRFK